MAKQIRPSIDPEIYEALAASPRQPSISRTTLQGIRDFTLSLTPGDEVLSRDGRINLEERAVPGPAGSPPISLLICRPVGLADRAPGIYHVHGGGMVSGNNRSAIDTVLEWAVELGAVVVSVEYRLAPEHPHPAPVEDCYAGLMWTALNAGALGIDPKRVLVAGASAGGGLAAALAIMARDRNGPDLIGQVLMYPMIDDRDPPDWAEKTADVSDFDWISHHNAWEMLLGSCARSRDVSIYAAPGRATDLSRLPSAFIDVGSADILRESVVTYTSRLWRDGGSAELHIWPGGCHGFDVLAPRARLSQAMTLTRTAWVRRLLTQYPKIPG